jgi:hypothetical protein
MEAHKIKDLFINATVDMGKIKQCLKFDLNDRLFGLKYFLMFLYFLLQFT